MINKIKIFGERHTATNAVGSMIINCFEISYMGYEYLGWKHRRAPKPSEWKKQPVSSTLFVITVRNPYTWLRAMYNEPYTPHQPDLPTLAFKRFLKYPFEDYENVIQMWNEKYEQYLEFINLVPNAVLVRTEDFCTDQQLQYSRLQHFGVRGEFKPFSRYSNGLDLDQEPQKDKIQREVLTLPIIPDDVVAMINEELAYDVMSKLGYQKVESCDGTDSVELAMLTSCLT